MEFETFLLTEDFSVDSRNLLTSNHILISHLFSESIKLDQEEEVFDLSKELQLRLQCSNQLPIHSQWGL